MDKNEDFLENLSEEEILKFYEDIIEIPNKFADACYSGPQSCIYSGTAK